MIFYFHFSEISSMGNFSQAAVGSAAAEASVAAVATETAAAAAGALVVVEVLCLSFLDDMEKTAFF